MADTDLSIEPQHGGQLHEELEKSAREPAHAAAISSPSRFPASRERDERADDRRVPSTGAK